MAHSNLTTAEFLIVEVVVLAHIAGLPHWTLEHERWVRPQLDELAERGLIEWRFDDDANFRVVPTQALVDGDEYQRIHAKLGIRETA